MNGNPSLFQSAAILLALSLTAGAQAGTDTQHTADPAPPEAPAAPVEQNTPDTAEPPSIDESLRFRLDEIVVAATRSDQPAFRLPHTTDIIDQSQLRDQSYRSTPEALRDIPGVMVQKTSHGQGSPFIRGFTGFRNVMLVDGVRLNNSVFRDGPNQYWNTVDPLSLGRIEVIKGPSSVLYGSDAIGGTVSATTKGPENYTDGFNSSGRVYYRASSAERSTIGRAELTFTQDQSTGVFLGFSTKDFGDLEAGSPTNTQPNTGYDEYDFDVKIEEWLSETTRLVIAHQTVRQNNVPRTHRTAFSKSFKGTTTGSDRRRDLDQERNLTYVQLHADEMDGIVDSMRLNLSWHRQEETRDRIKSSGARDLQGFEVNTLGLWGQFASETNFGRLTYGAEWYRDYVSSFSTKNPIQGPVADDATYDLVGVYLQDEIDINERTLLVIGGRFNYAHIDADSVQDPVTSSRISISDNWSSLVGSARVSHSLIPEHLNIFAGISQGFRAPNLSDLTRLDSARTNEIETPSPGLDSEEFLSYEVGLKSQGETWAAQLSYYYTVIDGLIIRTPTGVIIGTENEITKLNGGDGFVQGIELGARVQPDPNWTVFGSLAWVEGEVETFPTSTSALVREPIDRLMPLNAQIGVRFDHPSDQFWVESTVSIWQKADKLSTRDLADTGRIPPGGTPAYEIYSIRGGWRARENMLVTIGLENLTDEDYRIHGSGQNEAGFNIVLGIEFTF